MPFFVNFRCVRDVLRVTVAFDHPVAVGTLIQIYYENCNIQTSAYYSFHNMSMICLDVYHVAIKGNRNHANI